MGSFKHNSPNQVLRDAEIALYRAKGDGRGGYRIFHPDMQSAAIDLYRTVGNLRNALEKDEFELYYQPIVSLASNLLVGFEALIRWNHPTVGIVPAGKFISIAEDSGLIYPIGIWTLHRACEQMSKWQNQLPDNVKLTISINISAKQLQNADLIDEIRTILSQTGIGPDSVILEVTESSIIQNMDLASQNTRKLKELGVQIHLDDFGVGYSSLNVLHHLPIDALKIDKSFIQQVARDPKSLDIVKSVLLLCKNLNVDVVAEGIETEFELNILKNIQCELGQGYFFSKPMDEKDASSLILQTMEW
jgi:EAL domain-containing protein (putative c-di-GMP-specific phosphodiesterase class I)